MSNNLQITRRQLITGLITSGFAAPTVAAFNPAAQSVITNFLLSDDAPKISSAVEVGDFVQFDCHHIRFVGFIIRVMYNSRTGRTLIRARDDVTGSILQVEI